MSTAVTCRVPSDTMTLAALSAVGPKSDLSTKTTASWLRASTWEKPDSVSMRVSAAGLLAATGSVSEALMPVDLDSVVVETFSTPPSLMSTWAMSRPSARLDTLAV